MVDQTKASELATMWAAKRAALSAPTTVAEAIPEGMRSEDQMSAFSVVSSVVGGLLMTVGKKEERKC